MRAASYLGLVASGFRCSVHAHGARAVVAVGCARGGSGRGYRIDLSRTLDAMGTLERVGTHWTTPDGRAVPTYLNITLAILPKPAHSLERCLCPALRWRAKSRAFSKHLQRSL
jgi:hypothetical protein